MIRKGRVWRGQWFYAKDEAARSYVWFHSVKDLVERAIESDGVDVVDLGPSGSDGEIKGGCRGGQFTPDPSPNSQLSQSSKPGMASCQVRGAKGLLRWDGRGHHP